MVGFFSRPLRLAILLLMMGVVLSACVPITDPNAAMPSATSEPPPVTTEATAESPSTTAGPTRVLRVGVDVGFPPFTYIDADGRLAGFEIDLMNTLTSLGDFEVTYLPTTFQQLLPGLNEGEYDVALGAITVSEQRKERYAFTTPYFGQGVSPVSYFSAGQGLAVPVDSTVAGVADLGADEQIGVKRSTTGERWATENLDAQIVDYATASDAFDALVAGELDGVIIDVAVIASFLRSGDVPSVRLGAGPLTEEEYAMAVVLDPDGENETLALLNDALAKAEGPVFNRLIQRWFGGP